MRASSFRLPLIFCSLGVLVISATAIWHSTCIAPEEQAEYNRDTYEALKKHVARKSGTIKKVTKQIRWNVNKRLWLSEKPPRLSVELQGSRSEVNITMKKSETRFIETFFDAQGIMQQELFYKLPDGKEVVFGENGELKRRGETVPATDIDKDLLQPMQRFRYFEAEHAIYDYQTHTLIAYDVNFWTYVAEGHEIVKDREKLWPESSGNASSMTVCHGGSVGALQFAAENLNMQVTPEW
jgi:hypothetical protein